MRSSRGWRRVTQCQQGCGPTMIQNWQGLTAESVAQLRLEFESWGVSGGGTGSAASTVTASSLAGAISARIWQQKDAWLPDVLEELRCLFAGQVTEGKSLEECTRFGKRGKRRRTEPNTRKSCLRSSRARGGGRHHRPKQVSCPVGATRSTKDLFRVHLGNLGMSIFSRDSAMTGGEGHRVAARCVIEGAGTFDSDTLNKMDVSLDSQLF